MQVEIEFLLAVAPIFTGYLIIFQSEEPLVHCMFDSLKTDLLKGISVADMCRIDLESNDNYLPLEFIDISGKAQLKVYLESNPGTLTIQSHKSSTWANEG